MDLALVENNVPRQLKSNETVILPSGAKIPARALSVWTEPQRNAVNVYEIGTAVETVPTDKKVVGRELRYDQPSNTVKWYQILGDLPLDERKTTMRAQVESKRIAVTEAGYSHDFGPALGGVHVLDTSERTHAGWLHYRNACKDQIDAGNGALIMELPIRTKAEVDLLVRANQGFSTMNSMRDREGSIIRHYRALNDNIRTAADHAALDAINIDAGWPA